ncbi:MAG: hypothetical protein ACOCW7_00995 [Bacteroidota bacterium]
MYENLRNKFHAGFAFIVFLSVVFFSQRSHGQNSFPSMEDSLKNMTERILLKEHDFERLTINHEFNLYFKQALEKKGSFDYPFDSLTNVSKLRSPDNSFRIITWFVPLSGNSFEFFGFFQYHDSRRDEYYLYTLTDKRPAQNNIEYETVEPENWYGAYYTELIHEKHNRKDYYTLLGWRSDNPLTRKRIIEPIRVMSKGKPSFGRPVFRYKDNKLRRIIFEYSSRVSMSVAFTQATTEEYRRGVDMILFDRMMPQKEFLKGKYQFYIPEANVFDGFVFEEGNWVFMPDVDARNPSRVAPQRPVDPLNEQNRN